MKKQLILAAAVLVGSVYSLVATSQHNPFQPKQHNKVTGSVAAPGKILPLPGTADLFRKGTFSPVASYRPSGINLASIALNQAGFTSLVFDRDGKLIFLEGQAPGAIKMTGREDWTRDAACYQYLETIKTAMKINDPHAEFRIKASDSDELGMEHMKLQQYFGDIPVWCAEVVLHSRNGVISLFNGRYYPTPLNLNTTPGISSELAVQTVIGNISGVTSYRELTIQERDLLDYDRPISELVIYHKDRDPDQPKLAWHITVRPNVLEVWEYFIDADDGMLIHFYNNTRSDGDVNASGTDLNGVSRSFHAYLENSVYYLVDISRPMFNPQNFDGVLSIYDAENTNPANQNFSASISTSTSNSWTPTEVSAMYNSSMAYEYFLTVHGRNSYNNMGGAIKSIINVSSETGGGYDNAYWNGIAVFYGNGDVIVKPLAGGLDVGAHEIGHAYEGTASNLEYQYQSGAISESYADIAGAMVERQNWTIGEQVVQPAYFPSGCMRDMSNPHNGGNNLGDPGYQPANVSEMYTGSDDNGGVHINSGIGNLAYFKTAQAIGIEKTEKIFWRASFNYLTRSSQFIDYRLNVIQSAKDLHGNNSAEVSAVAAAFDFVGITDGQGGNYQNQIPVNPGPDYLLLYDLIESDQNTLYLCSTSGTDFIPISETVPFNKPSVVDDGSYAIFISDDNKMRYIALDGDNPDEEVIQNDAIWHNAAISKDGSMISAITTFEDSAIWVYSYQRQEWARYHLYNATTAQGEETHTVIYADAMEWDYSGEYIIYDALSRVENPFGEPIEWWDINFIKVWDNASNYWGSGDIFKVFGGLPEGVSVGNPSFAKNSPYIFAFDIYEPSTDIITIAAANFENGNVGEIWGNYSVLGTPNYSKLDDYLIFTIPDDLDAIAIIELSEDKINPASENADYLVTEAKWGIWFAQGYRDLEIPEYNAENTLRVFPNPATGQVRLDIEVEAGDRSELRIFDIRGCQVHDMEIITGNDPVINLDDLGKGMYFIQVKGNDTLRYGKVMIR